MKATTNKLNTKNLYKLLKRHLPLLSILAGSLLASFSMGPFSNWDAQLEYGAASSVLQNGFYLTPNGALLNQPPVGYYIDALFLGTFGLSYSAGVAIVTLFGVGCVLLVYVLGKELYDRNTGILAAGLFALSPWHVILSRTFLIDTQCLFFSLLYLLVGIQAIRKDSHKLTFLAGVLFGVAFLTKAFAVFMLIPLTIIFLYSRRRIFRPWLGATLFALPALFLNFFWYQLISRQGFFALLRHDDFSNSLPAGLAPSPFFVGDYLLSSAGLGIFLTAAVTVSLAVGVFGRRILKGSFLSDAFCFLTVVEVGGLVTVLVLGFGLAAPYAGLVKYLYQVLPLFCLLAASLATKYHLLRVARSEKRRWRVLSYVALSGVGLLVAALVFDGVLLVFVSGQSYVQFSVSSVSRIAYAFHNPFPSVGFGDLLIVQVLGFVFVFAGFVWALRKKLQV